MAVHEFEVHPNNEGGYINWLLDVIYKRYKRMHPKLIPDEYGSGPIAYPLDGTRVFEAYTYYAGEKVFTSADIGTRLRFVEPIIVQSSTLSSEGGKDGQCNIPGIVDVPAEFPLSLNCHPVYFDHWVSNVM